MKEKELRKAAVCAVCHKRIGEAQLPLFWRVRIRRFGVLLDVVKRQAGLEMMMDGHVAIAQIMGPDEDMAKLISEIEITVCEKCACDKALPVAVLAMEPDEEESPDDETGEDGG